MKKSIIIICSVAALFFAANLTSCSSGGTVDQAAVNKMSDSLLNVKKTALMDSLHMANMAACQDSMNAWGEKMNKKGKGGHSTATKPSGMTTSTPTKTETPPAKGGGTVTTKGGGTTGTGGTTPVVTHKGGTPLKH